MDIVVPHRIRKQELGGRISEEARKVFTKLKERPEIAEGISARDLPANTTLHKVYATTKGGPRRILFFCRHHQDDTTNPERWVLLFYRNKGDDVGDNMSQKNPEFVSQLRKKLQAALTDLAESTAQAPKYDLL
jgi:hypothetical protein